MSLSFVPIGNESVPIQLAQCRFLGLVIHSAKILIYFQVKYTEAILSNSSRKLLWFEITKLLIVSFITIFVKTLSIYGTPVVISLGRRNPATASERVSIGAAVSISDQTVSLPIADEITHKSSVPSSSGSRQINSVMYVYTICRAFCAQFATVITA